MRCSKCGFDNQPSMKFCGECATPLPRPCPKCGFENPPGHKFCGQCAAPLSAFAVSVKDARTSNDTLPAVLSAPEAREELSGERKTVTALFADIKGSMELMEDLDPEEARAIVDPALRLMIDAVHRYDGYIVQSTGDGIFALFGAPVSHEDHPQRALYSALRMQEELRRYSAKLREGGNLAVEARVGVNTGEVVVRSIRTGETHSEYTAIGHSTSLASRMQALAPTGSIAATAQVRKLCEGYFVFKDLGPTRVKGVAEPVSVYEVTGLGPLRTRLQVSARRGLTRFVGRDSELAQMRRALELAVAGHGQIVGAVGEPGVGKSRLFFEFKAVAQSGCLVLDAYSVSHGKASAYLPVIDLLKSYFGIVPEDNDRKRREKVAGKVVILDRSVESALPYLYSLLGISEDDDALAEFDPQTRRQRTLQAVKGILTRESLNQPLIVEFEDLHWIDSETQVLLDLLVDGLATARILLLVNYRPEYHHQWGNKTYYTQLRLDPLGNESSQEMLSALLGCDDDDEILPLKRLIVERTEGNPFFMEEMVQALFEQGVLIRDGALKLAKALKDIRVPPTVQAILGSRIDRLPATEKELLQTLAVLGRQFPLGLVKRVIAKPDDGLERMLADLQLAEFIYEQPAIGDVEYIFKHALTQEVAYNSVLLERRKLLHERAGEGIEALFARQLDEHLGELARHYGHSPNLAKAVNYLHLAGLQAAQNSAYGEAVSHFSSALVLLKGLPENPDRAERELRLRLSLANSLKWTKGIGSEETGGALIQARELCAQVGEGTELFAVPWGLYGHYMMRSDQDTARTLAEQLLALAERAHEPGQLMSAHEAMGTVLHLRGEFAAARQHLEQASPRHAWRQRDHISYPCLGAWTLWALGYAEQALKWSREALALSDALSRPGTLANTLALTAWLHMYLRDVRMAQARAEATIAISTEYGFPFELAHGTFVRGWALAQQGHLEEGIAEMRRAETSYETTGSGSHRLCAFIAEPRAKSEGLGTGLKVLAEGITLMEKTVEREFEAEMHRVRGELLLMQGAENTTEAEHCFRNAIQVAKRQAGKAWELRATVSLARLLASQGHRDEARAILADIYNWFTEGFDTADLKDAKALLDELSD